MSENDLDARIDRLAQMLQGNALGKPLVEFAILQEVEIHMMENLGRPAYFAKPFMGPPVIYLNDRFDDYTLFVALAHEARHCAQDMCLQTLLYELSLEEAIYLNRVLEADASAYSNAVAYQQYLDTGDEGFLKGMEVYKEQDIRDAFIKMLTPGKPLLKDKAPFQAAFNQWFSRKSRVNHYDRELINGYSKFQNSFLSAFFPACSTKITKGLMRSIGDLSYRVNYLRGKGAPDLSLAMYKTVNNPANQRRFQKTLRKLKIVS